MYVHLRPRLSRALDMLRGSQTVADIGSDHGRLAVALLQQGAAERVIACDISAPSLEKARALCSRVRPRRPHGLSGGGRLRGIATRRGGRPGDGGHGGPGHGPHPARRGRRLPPLPGASCCSPRGICRSSGRFYTKTAIAYRMRPSCWITAATIS